MSRRFNVSRESQFDCRSGKSFKRSLTTDFAITILTVMALLKCQRTSLQFTCRKHYLFGKEHLLVTVIEVFHYPVSPWLCHRDKPWFDFVVQTHCSPACRCRGCRGRSTRWPLAEQVLAQMRTEEPGAAGHDRRGHRCSPPTQYAPRERSTAPTVRHRMWHVAPQRPGLHVLQVETHHVVERQVAAPADLPQPRDARLAGRDGAGAQSSMSHSRASGSGRGPTRLMSPLSTFRSWGSSSRLSGAGTLPTGVTRGIVPQLEQDAVRFVQLLQVFLRRPGVLDHGAELVAAERTAGRLRRARRRRTRGRAR